MMSSCVVAASRPLPVRATCFRTLNATTFARVRSSVAVNSSQAIQ